ISPLAKRRASPVFAFFPVSVPPCRDNHVLSHFLRESNIIYYKFNMSFCQTLFQRVRAVGSAYGSDVLRSRAGVSSPRPLTAPPFYTNLTNFSSSARFLFTEAQPRW